MKYDPTIINLISSVRSSTRFPTSGVNTVSSLPLRLRSVSAVNVQTTCVTPPTKNGERDLGELWATTSALHINSLQMQHTQNLNLLDFNVIKTKGNLKD
jgi:hypothetical protein